MNALGMGHLASRPASRADRLTQGSIASGRPDRGDTEGGEDEVDQRRTLDLRGRLIVWLAKLYYRRRNRRWKHRA